MQHLIYLLVGFEKAPQGGGDTRSWFFHYKLNISPEDETYVPSMDTEGRHLCLGAPKAGDVLWFQMADEVSSRIVGCAKISRVETNFTNGQDEYWYKGEDIVELDVDLTGEVLDSIRNGELWKQVTQKFLSKMQSGSETTNENGST